MISAMKWDDHYDVKSSYIQFNVIVPDQSAPPTASDDGAGRSLTCVFLFISVYLWTRCSRPGRKAAKD
jgi:hypothetical protein